MPTTFTTSLRLWEGQPGDPAVRSEWGYAINENMVLIEAAILGTASVNITGLTAYTLTTANGNTDQARPYIQSYTGAITGNCTVTLPNVPKIGWAQNTTTGGFSVILTTGSGSTATIPSDSTFYWYMVDGAGNVTIPTFTYGTLSGVTLSISGNGTIGGTLDVVGALTAGSTLAVAGNTTVGGTLGVSGLLTAGGVTASGNVTVGGTLGVTGALSAASSATITGTLTANGSSVFNGSSTFNSTAAFGGNNVTGSDFNISGGSIINTPIGGIDPQPITGTNVNVTGTLGVSGTSTLSNVVVFGSCDLDNAVTLGGSNANPIGALSNNWFVNTNGAAAGYSSAAYPLSLGSGSGVFAAFFNFSTPVGSINYSGGLTNYNQTSDERLKIDDGLISGEEARAVIMALLPRWFRMKSDPDAIRQPGFFAQQFHRVWRWGVTKGRGKPGDIDFKPWQMDASKVIPALVAHNQAMQREIDALKGR